MQSHWDENWADKMPGKRRVRTRRDDVRHMCPEEGCGLPANPHCPACHGTGTLTDDQLDRWQTIHNLSLG